jgi:hypothetical protein
MIIELGARDIETRSTVERVAVVVPETTVVDLTCNDVIIASASQPYGAQGITGPPGA